MKKQALLIILYFTFIATSYTQDDYYSNHLESSSSVGIPVSPEAASLGRYGNLPYNSSTGQMSFSVPIYEISTPVGNWPISLQYGYNGLMLEGKPSLVGLGWVLPANGAVTREVRGLPDEHQNGYYGTGVVKSIIDNYIANDIDVLTISDLKNFRDGVYDSEVDKYNVNVGAVNFTFKIDANDNPVYLSKHSHIITSITRDQSNMNLIESFSVIDDKGIKYDFGGTDAIEKSIPNSDEDLLLNAYTSWNLTRITYINGQQINFSYQPDTFTNYNFSASGTAQLGDVADDFINAPVFYAPTYGETSLAGTIERRLLDSITFPGGSIDFNIIDNLGRKLYSSVQIKNPAGAVITDYQFTYFGARDALTYISKNQLHYYRFEYHGVDDTVTIPDFMNASNDRPLAQDNWKYYNGEGGNTSAISIPNSTYTANKEINFEKTRLGAMKKIIYPTKGYTKITYEQNQVSTANIIGSDYYQNLEMESEERVVRLEGNYGNGNLPQYKVALMGLTFNYPTVINLRHFVTINNNTSHINMEIARFDKITQTYTDCPYNEYYPSSQEGFYLPSTTNTEGAQYYNYVQALRDEIIRYNSGRPESDLNPNAPYICPQYLYLHDPESLVPNNSGSASKLVVLPGKYRFKIFTEFAGTTDAVAEIGVRLQKDWDLPPPTMVNVDVGGIRVASLQDFTNESEANPSVTRTFDYNDQGFSTGKLTVIPLGEEIHTYRHTLLDNTITYREIHVYSSNPFTALNPTHGSPIHYKSIKEYNGQDNGFVLREYYPPIEDNSYHYPKRPVGVDLTKGRVKSEEAFKFKNGVDPELISVSNYGYQQVRGIYSNNFNNVDENPNHPWSFKMAKKKDLWIDFTVNTYPENPSSQAEIDAVKGLFTIAGYKELDSWSKKVSDTKNNLFDGDSVTQLTNYFYNNHQHINKQTTTTSDGDVLERHIEYPYDINEPIYNAMVQNNQIAQPVTTKVLENSTLLSQSKTEFKAGVFGYFPNVINTSKGNYPLEPRIRFDYDANGNVIQQEKLSNATVNSIATSYIWGYNNKYPVAKVENVSYAEVLSTGIDLSLISNSNTTDANMRMELDKIRQGLPNAMVTTYTYDPLIGVTSITDPRGYTIYYEYDDFNRLQQVKDAEGNILSKNEYNYKN